MAEKLTRIEESIIQDILQNKPDLLEGSKEYVLHLMVISRLFCLYVDCTCYEDNGNEEYSRLDCLQNELDRLSHTVNMLDKDRETRKTVENKLKKEFNEFMKINFKDQWIDKELIIPTE